MDLIYMNESKKDIDVLKDYTLDLAYGSDENDFECKVNINNNVCKTGYYLYFEGEEYGGVIDSVGVDTDETTVTYSGRTWHGILESKVLQPDEGEDYLIVSGEANEVLKLLIDRMGLSELFKVSTLNSNIQISSYQMNRYIKGYTGIMKMLKAYNAKLNIVFNRGFVELSASPLADYSQDEQFDTDQISFTIKRNSKHINHVICLGRGDLKDRRVIHIYCDLLGNISGTQTLTGLDEMCEIYDNSNAESDEDLIQGGIDKITESFASDSVDFSLDSNDQYIFDVNDKVGAREQITGTYVVASVSKKIVNISNNSTSISYDCEADTVSVSAGPYPSSGDGSESGQTVSIKIGSVTTGGAGSDAEVKNAGDNKNMILDFVIPKGDKGQDGAAGAKGEKGDQGDKGADGAPGADGKDGVDGKSISEVINYYLATSASSGVTAKTSGWTTTVQSVSASKKYLWNYEVVKLSDGKIVSTSMPCIIGAYGDRGNPGADGKDGSDGANGTDGIGIKEIEEFYAVSTSNTKVPTSWATTVPTMTATNKYLWNYETITYTNNTSVDTAKKVIGVYGDKGAAGAKGDTGATGKGVKSTAVAYQVGVSGTTVPTGTWSASIPAADTSKPYLWTRTIITYTDNTTSTSYSVGATPEGMVQKKKIISEINQSAEEISIKAEKISLEGLVTANENFKVLEDGSIEAKNGKFTGDLTTTSSLRIYKERVIGNNHTGKYMDASIDVDVAGFSQKVYGLQDDLSVITASSEVTGLQSLYIDSNTNMLKVPNYLVGTNAQFEYANFTTMLGAQQLAVAGNAGIGNNLRVGNVLNVGSQISIWSDAEGGNIKLKSPGNFDYQIDTNGDKLRIYTFGNDGVYRDYPLMGLDGHNNRVLWSGGWWPVSSQTAYLSQPISAQPNGIVIVFRSYTPGVGMSDGHYSFYFVPKARVTNWDGDGGGHSVYCSSSDMSYVANKYLYIGDTWISGNDNNSKGTYTSPSGIKSTPNRFAMFRIIGV